MPENSPNLFIEINHRYKKPQWIPKGINLKKKIHDKIHYNQNADEKEKKI